MKDVCLLDAKAMRMSSLNPSSAKGVLRIFSHSACARVDAAWPRLGRPRGLAPLSRQNKNQERFGTHHADARALPPFPPLRLSLSARSAVFVSLPREVKDKTADPAEQGIKNVIEGYKQSQKQSGTRKGQH
jgi:hypothetical protein